MRTASFIQPGQVSVMPSQKSNNKKVRVEMSEKTWVQSPVVGKKEQSLK